MIVGLTHLRTLHVACERKFPRTAKFVHAISGLQHLTDLAMPLGNAVDSAMVQVSQKYQLRVEDSKIRNPTQLANILRTLTPSLSPSEDKIARTSGLWREVLSNMRSSRLGQV